MIGSRMKVVAQRASEPEYVVIIFHLKIQQIDNDCINGDLVSKPAKKICGIMFGHRVISYGRENSAIVSFTKDSVIFF